MRRRHGRLHRRDGRASEGACRTVRRARRTRAIGPPGIGPLRRLRKDRHSAPAQPGSFEGGPSAVVVSRHRETDDRRLGTGPRHPSARHLRGRTANLQPDACARVRRASGTGRRRHRGPSKSRDHRRPRCCPRCRRAVRRQRELPCREPSRCCGCARPGRSKPRPQHARGDLFRVPRGTCGVGSRTCARPANTARPSPRLDSARLLGHRFGFHHHQVRACFPRWEACRLVLRPQRGRAARRCPRCAHRVARPLSHGGRDAQHPRRGDHRLRRAHVREGVRRRLPHGRNRGTRPRG